MTYKHTFTTALKGLTTNRSRSALTILGIVIGITAIMLVVSLGAGAQKLILGAARRRYGERPELSAEHTALAG